MDKKRKEYIDSLWKNTELYDWILAASNENVQQAKEIKENLFNKGYWGTIKQLDEEISELILKEIKNTAEFDEYMKMLDEENSDMVQVMISNGIFDHVYDVVWKADGIVD